MKPLDDVSRRLFPTLAATEDRMRWYIRGAMIVSILAVYVLGRDLLSAYQGRIATENMHDMVGRVNNLEAACQREYPSRAKITKAQAWNAAQDREKGKEERP